MKLKSTLLIVLFLTSLSCAQKNDGSPGLTADQKSRFVETLNSIGRAQDAVRFAGSSGVVTPAQAFLFLQNIPGGSDDSLRAQMTSTLGQGQCKISVSGYDSVPGAAGSSNVAMTATGATCPIEMNLAVNMAHTQTPAVNETKGSVACSYSVKDPRYADFNDITSITENGTVQKTLNFGSTGSFSLSGGINIKGTLTSQKYGTVYLAITGQMSGTSMSLTSSISYTLQYSDYIVELKQLSSATQAGYKTAYYLAGAEITQQEFESYLTSGGPIINVGTDK